MMAQFQYLTTPENAMQEAARLARGMQAEKTWASQWDGWKGNYDVMAVFQSLTHIVDHRFYSLRYGLASRGWHGLEWR